MEDDKTTKTRQYVTDQRVEIIPGEARKGVNVLNTSDPKNPAINPFVPVQNQTSQTDQGTSQSGQGDQGSNNQSKE